MHIATVIISNIENFLNICSQKLWNHVFVMLLFIRMVTWSNMSCVILAHTSTFLVFSLSMEYGWLLYTMHFKHPQRKKSKDVRSGNPADYSVCLTYNLSFVLVMFHPNTSEWHWQNASELFVLLWLYMLQGMKKKSVKIGSSAFKSICINVFVVKS